MYVVHSLALRGFPVFLHRFEFGYGGSDWMVESQGTSSNTAFYPNRNRVSAHHSPLLDLYTQSASY